MCRYSFALRCGCYATVRRDLIIGWTYSTQKRIGLSEQPVRCEGGGLGHVVLCKLLSGSGYRLRATRTIGEFTRDRRLLPKSAIALAEACRAGTSDGWRPGPQERSSGFIGRQNRRSMPGGIRETGRRIDRTRHPLVALDVAATPAPPAATPRRAATAGLSCLPASQGSRWGSRGEAKARAKLHTRGLGSALPR